jgi:5'-deoxynucleotidase YfbR-like HD superfamily hydrolase
MSDKNNKNHQVRKVGDGFPLKRSRHFNSIRTLNEGEILSDTETKAVQEFLSNLPNLQEYKLDQPIVSAEDEQLIKSFFETPKQFISTVGDNNAWIQTFSGRKFFPLNPQIDSIIIQDIAHALSMLCRFTGHCKFFYSVAQHCVLVSYLCDTADQLYGLLHDASEAYLVDIPTPLKRTPQFEFYKKAEHHLQSMIFRKFGLTDVEPPSVKQADKLMLATEAINLLPNLHPEWKLPCKALPVVLSPMSPTEAEQLFLDRFNELFNKQAA